MLVVVGGLLGSALRYAMVPPGEGIRAGLIVANLGGALMAGLLVGRVAHHSHEATWLWPVAVIGFAGSLTTFSTLAVDTVLLLEAASWDDAVALAAASLLAGPMAAVVGIRIGRAR
jgi:CrcB protein